MNWTKSSYSPDVGNCVEIASDGPTVHLRNSNHPDRATLSLPAPAVATFVASCRAGNLDDLTT